MNIVHIELLDKIEGRSRHWIKGARVEVAIEYAQKLIKSKKAKLVLAPREIIMPIKGREEEE